MLLPQHPANAFFDFFLAADVVDQQLNLDVQVAPITHDALGGAVGQQDVIVLGEAQQFTAPLHHGDNFAPLVAESEIFANRILGHFQVFYDVHADGADESAALVIFPGEKTPVFRENAVDFQVAGAYSDDLGK